MGKIIDFAVDWFKNIANDDSHGYDQSERWGVDYDCSSSTIQGFHEAFKKYGKKSPKDYGATYTGNMRVAFEKAGFKSIKYTKNIPLKKGDVILNEKHHVVVCVDDGATVFNASINELGKTTGGKTGDQTGREIRLCPMYQYSKGWDYILRYDEKEEVVTDPKENPYPEPLNNLKKGDRSPYVSWLQWELRQLGYSLEIDQSFGNTTRNCLLSFQNKYGLTADAICGKKTVAKLKEVNHSNAITCPYPRPTRTLRVNCKGDDVAYVQWHLVKKNKANIAIDKSYGKLTRQAVIDFQKKAFSSQPNEWDGIVGKKTLAELEK